MRIMGLFLLFLNTFPPQALMKLALAEDQVGMPGPASGEAPDKGAIVP
jgi:hypothetical protein